MSNRISLTDYLELSDNSKTCAPNSTKNKISADTKKKIAIKAEKHGVNNSSDSFDDFFEKIWQLKLCSGNNASAQANNQVKENHENMIEQRVEHWSEESPALKKNRRCRSGKYIKKKGDEFKSTLIPYEFSKFKNNAVSVVKLPEENQQNDNVTAEKFTLMPFDIRTDPSKFAILQQYLQNARCEEAESFVNLKHAIIYKVNCHGYDSDDFKFGNCLMLHGTSFDGSKKILNEGYKNSPNGYFGKGVYMTESLDMAVYYSIRKTLKDWTKSFRRKKLMKTYFFVNQVSELKSLKVEKYLIYKLQYDNGSNHEAPKHPFCKHMHKDSPDRKLTIDVEGRLYTHKKISGLNLVDEYVAKNSLVKPRYLIIIEPSGLDYEKFLEFDKYLDKKIV